MLSLDLQCPNCGGVSKRANRFVKTLICPYCDQTIAVESDGASLVGPAVTLQDLWTELKVGASGEREGTPFTIFGRVRYRYDEGWWDEWYVVGADGTEAWLQEDEGDLTWLAEAGAAPSARPDEARVGSRWSVGGRSLYVTEKRAATIQGFEGQVPRDVRPGQQLVYVDGHDNGTAMSVEFVGGAAELFVGTEIAVDDLQLRGV